MDARMRPVQTSRSPQGVEEARVAEEVVRALAASGRFRSDPVEVSSSEGVVRLRGRVGSYYQKQVAQVAALTVIGGRQLVNEIEVT
jgi:osmotically-inducible protein OsmY